LRWNSLGAAHTAGEKTSGSVRPVVDGAGPFFHTTPSEALRALVREKVFVEGRTFFITRPVESERIQDHPAVQAAAEKDDYLPYWTDLWPAARMLAKVILREPPAPGTRVLELGSGLGLPGIAALACGLRVTFSDCDATALEFAAANARANGFHDFNLLLLDWRYPPDGLHFPVVLASDLVYELRNINPIVAFLKRVLEPDGICLLTDQDRLPAYNLREALDGERMAYTTQALHAGERGGRRTRGTLYRIKPPAKPGFA
jgi:predicted nicotinamide N-methyase